MQEPGQEWIFVIMPIFKKVGIIISRIDHLNFFSFQDSKESFLESNKKRKDRLKSKENKRKKEDLQEVDGEIEAVLQKRGAMQVLQVAEATLSWREASLFQAGLLGGPSVCGDIYWKIFQYVMGLVYVRNITYSSELLLNH